MAQYINKDALVAEIERRKQTWQHQDQQYVNGGKDVCDYLLGFLDTLEVKEVQEEPVNEDLEKACEQLAENARKHKAETSSPFFSPTDYKQGVIDGAKWQKEQMMAKAIDGDVTFDYYGDDDKTYGCIAHDSFCLEDFGLEDMTKVKMILIKEE